MDLRTLKETLADWTDWDVAMFELGRCLGVFGPEVTLATDAKGTIWSDNSVSRMLLMIMLALVTEGVMEVMDEDRYRMNPNYNWRDRE